MGYIIGALLSAVFVAVVSLLLGVRIFIWVVSTRAGWITLGLLLIAAVIYMATHEPIWDRYLNDPSITPFVDRGPGTPAPTATP